MIYIYIEMNICILFCIVFKHTYVYFLCRYTTVHMFLYMYICIFIYTHNTLLDADTYISNTNIRRRIFGKSSGGLQFSGARRCGRPVMLEVFVLGWRGGKGWLQLTTKKHIEKIHRPCKGGCKTNDVLFFIPCSQLFEALLFETFIMYFKPC